MKRYYYAGGQRIVMRLGTTTLRFLLGDHLGSTAITATTTGSKLAELRYYPWGGVRYTYGTTPTDYRFTGQQDSTILILTAGSSLTPLSRSSKELRRGIGMPM